MPTGERPVPRARPAHGFTYVVLLFALVLAGTGLAALGTHWQQQARREREAELLFRGLQLRDALLRYAEATPDGQPPQPAELADLLDDRRSGRPQHHLRRLWPDPFTGLPDWQLLRNEAGGITGLHSRATLPALRRQRLPAGVPAPANPTHLVSDWIFSAAASPSAVAPAPDTLRSPAP